MKFFLDLQKKQLVKSAASNVPLERVVLKRRDQLALDIAFVQRNALATMPPGTQVSVGLKRQFSDPAFLAFAAPGTNTLNLYTEPVEAAFLSTSPSSIPALLEFRWTLPGETTRTATLTVELQNSVILGDEGTPAVMPDGKATQAEAESGTDNAKWMTPLRTFQAIAAWVTANLSWSTLTGKPTSFPPSAHDHTSSDITDFAEAVVAAAPPTTDASLLTSGTLADDRLSATATASLAKADTASQPGHAHAIGDTADLQTALDAKQNLRTTVSLTLQDGDNYLPASRNTLYLLSGSFTTARINLPTHLPNGTGAWVGDRIRIVWVGARANANSRINVIAFAGNGQYPSLAQLHDQDQAAEFVLDNIPRNASGQLTWRSDLDPIRWVQPPATPASLVAPNGAAYSPSDVAFDGAFFYIRGRKTDGSPVWLRTPMSSIW